MEQHAIEQAAGIILAARLSRTPLVALPEECRPQDESDAYRVQEALNTRLTASGVGPLAGHKIGCTTQVMQAYLQIPNPCAGAVFAPTVHRRTGTFRAADSLRLGVECEIAVELSSDLDGRHGRPGARTTRAALAGAVGSVMASIEVVDDRYADYRALGTPTLIADDFFNAGAVLGGPVRDWRRLDLASIGGRMLVNDEEVGRGRGSDILGHPLEALAWLVGNLAARGRALKRGEFVTLGSIVATRWVQPGDTVRIEIEGLGEAVANIE